eukprot:s4477_g2.t1
MALGWLLWRTWSPVVRRDAAAFCVAGVEFGHIHAHFVQQARHLVTIDVAYVWTVWHLVALMLTLLGWHLVTLMILLCGTRGTGLGQAWLLQHWAGSGGALGCRLSRLMPRGGASPLLAGAEVEYPHQLCRQWAACLHSTLLEHGALGMPLDLQQDVSAPLHLRSKASLGVQPRGKKLRPLMKEDAAVVKLTGPETFIKSLPLQLDVAIVLPPQCTAFPVLLVLPARSKQIHAPILQGEDAGPQDERLWTVQYGIPWSPEEFARRAADLSHPGHFLDGVHEVMSSSFERMKTLSTSELAQERTAAMRKWSMRAMHLKSTGEDGKENSPDHAKKILKSKNLKLFAEMVKESGSPDLSLCTDIANGFNLMGPMPSGGIFPCKPLHATLEPGQVRDMADMARAATWSNVRREGDNPMREEIYASTLEECKKGWMSGPYTLDDLPSGAVLTRRFGVQQSSTLADGTKIQKFRPIDDFSESLVNVTNSCDETILPMGVDQICSTLVRRMRLRPGEQLLCKAIDLQKAYKDLPLSKEALHDSGICVYSPSAKAPQAFQTLVLPFGARAAVMGFCRVSYAIWRIGVVLFNLHWTVYFDDYFLVAEVHESRHVEMAQQLLFLLLGWETSNEKEACFGGISRVLGVQIDLSETRMGAITVSNVESRVKDIVSMIDDVLSKGVASLSEVRVLCGRIVFAEAQIFGRLAGIHMKRLGRLEHVVPLWPLIRM